MKISHTYSITIQRYSAAYERPSICSGQRQRIPNITIVLALVVSHATAHDGRTVLACVNVGTRYRTRYCIHQTCCGANPDATIS